MTVSEGNTANATVTVSEGNTAKTMGSGSLDVFATPAMIALMERAACDCVAGALEPGQTTVGIRVEVEHTAASPLGVLVSATATVTAVNGRRITFDVAASDSHGVIGHGTHERIIVDTERFADRVNSKKRDTAL